LALAPDSGNQKPPCSGGLLSGARLWLDGEGIVANDGVYAQQEAGNRLSFELRDFLLGSGNARFRLTLACLSGS
jgi:hypothetical protein